MPVSYNTTPIAVCGSSDFLDYCDNIEGCIERIPLTKVSERPHAFFLHIAQLALVTIDGDYVAKELAEYAAALDGSEHYVLIIDFSDEGWALNGRFALNILAMHQIIGRQGFIPAKTCIIHHNNLMIENPDIYRDFCNYNDCAPFRMIYSQSRLLNQAKFVSEKFSGKGAFDRIAASYFQDPERGIVKTHKYLCYNYVPRFPRVMLLMKLLERDLLGEGIVSFAGFRIPDIDYDFYVDAQTNLMQRPDGASYSRTLSSLADMSPLIVDGTPGSTKYSLAYQFEAEPYRKSLFSIVTEAGFGNGLHLRCITEKFLKPVLHMHPFILLGEPGGLAEVRNLGFQTFEDFIDESYDKVLSADRRMEKIVDAVEELCAFDLNTLQELRARSSTAVFHNLHHLAYNFYDRVRDLSERNVIEYIRKALDANGPTMSEAQPIEDRSSDAPPQSYQELVLDPPLGINVSLAWDDIIVSDGRKASYLQDDSTHGNHCVLIRGASGQGEKLRIGFEVKNRGATSLMVHIASPLRTDYQFIYNLDLGVIISSEANSINADIECSAKHLDNGWIRIGFEGQIGLSEGPLNIILYISRNGFEYAAEVPAGILIANFSAVALRAHSNQLEQPVTVVAPLSPLPPSPAQPSQ